MNPPSAAQPTPIGQADPVVAKSPETALDGRIREVETLLGDATYAVHDLVGRLEPVLPPGFGSRAVTSPAEGLTEPSSPLAGRLAELGTRGQVLVAMLRGICESVDL